MGKKCAITKELCGNAHCTTYDGTTDRDIIIKKGSNIWTGLHEEIPKGVWCDDCKESYKMKASAIHDITNLSIGETKKPFNKNNLKKFMDLANCTYEKCKTSGECI